MAISLAKLIVDLQMQTRQYEQKLDAANRRLKKFESTTKRSLGSIDRNFSQLGRSPAKHQANPSPG